jgi:hypothetical protein
MTYTTIAADVQSFLGFAIGASSRITSTEVSQWINQDYRVAQSRLADADINYYQGETVEFNTTANDGEYSLAYGGDAGNIKFLKEKRIEIQYDDNTDKRPMTRLSDINDVYASFDPANDPWSKLKPYYLIWENKLYIKPIPDESSSTWTTDAGSAIKMWFIEEQDDISGSTEPLLPTAWQHILAYGATARGFRKLQKFDFAREYQAMWQQGLNDMVASVVKSKKSVMSFKVTRGSDRSHTIWRA